MGDEVRFASVGLARWKPCASAVSNRVRRLHHLRRLRWQRPPAIFLDANRDRLVALRIEVLKNRRRRRERDFVLAGPAAVDHADPQFFHATKLSTTEDAGDTGEQSCTS